MRGLLPSLQLVLEKVDVFASTCALARAFPLYSRRSSIQKERHVRVEYILVGEGTVSESLTCQVLNIIIIL